jgi:PPOX class probable F420-dependent enzyme
MTAPDLGNHMLLTTFRNNGQAVPTPVWNVALPDGRIGMWTAAGAGKWKRLRNNPHVTIQRCTARGHVKPDAPVHSGTAAILRPGPEGDDIRARILARHKHEIAVVKVVSRLQGRLKAGQQFGDTIIAITLDDQPAPQRG